MPGFQPGQDLHHLRQGQPSPSEVRNRTMKRPQSTSLACLLASLALLSSQALAQESKIQVTKPAWQGYQQYLGGTTDQRHGFFAMSKDGQNWGQSGCAKGACPPDEQLKASAMK